MQKNESLGLEVSKYLKEQGVETPMVSSKYKPQDKFEIVKESIHNLMNAFSLNMSDDSLQDTPERVSKMYVNELFKGLDYSNFPKCTTNENKMKYNEPVIVKGIQVISFCEHHFATIEGTATIKYIPNDRVIGLSKFHRVTDFFCRRPQMQERLTLQIFHALAYILNTESISVEITASHNCVKTRGVQQHGSETVTSKKSGLFKESINPLI